MPESKTMDTEAGGESTQYESIKTQTVPPAKQTGQLGDPSEHTAESAGQAVSKERGEKTAENMRYGQAISEQGVGGFTNTTSGQAQQGGYGGADADKSEEQTHAAATRRGQGYGPGSGVGA